MCCVLLSTKFFRLWGRRFRILTSAGTARVDKSSSELANAARLDADREQQSHSVPANGRTRPPYRCFLGGKGRRHNG